MCNGHSFNWVIRGKLCKPFPHVNYIIRSYSLRQKYVKVCRKQLGMQAAGVKLVQVSESQADTAAKILTFVKKWKLTLSSGTSGWIFLFIFIYETK